MLLEKFFKEISGPEPADYVLMEPDLVFGKIISPWAVDYEVQKADNNYQRRIIQNI